MTKRYGLMLALVLALVMVLLVACGGSPSEPAAGEGDTAEADCSSPDVFCVGLVTDVGEIDDKSFNQSAWEGAFQLLAAARSHRYVVRTMSLVSRTYCIVCGDETSPPITVSSGQASCGARLPSISARVGVIVSAAMARHMASRLA